MNNRRSWILTGTALALLVPIRILHPQTPPEAIKAMATEAKPKFDVLSVKSSDPEETGKKLTMRGRHILAVNMNLNDLITFAYDLNPKQLVGAPKWFANEGFDLDGIPDTEGRASTKQLKSLIQSALSERFKLTFHTEPRLLSVYALTVGKGGSKIAETTHPVSDLAGFNIGGLGEITVTNATMKDFCNGLQNAVLDRPVVDQTGLASRYDFRLRWTPDESQFAALGPGAFVKRQEDPNAPPALTTAIQEQAGLRLEAVRARADVFIVDHVERPTPN